MKHALCTVALLLSASSLIGCPTATPPPAYATRGADCPEPPDAASRIEEIEQLGRSARETRANLITQWPRDGAAGQRIVATLHDPHLTLIESILQTPRRARQPDAAWLRNNLLRASIELRSAKPIAVLERGDSRALRLTTEGGSRLPILFISRQRDGESWLYRLAYDPPLIDRALTRLALALPLEPQNTLATFGWALSRRNLARLDRLPVAYRLAWQRDLLLARKAALRGDLVGARRLAARVSSCESTSEVTKLVRALRRKHVGPRKTFDFGVSDEPGLGATAARPIAADLALRAAVLSRFAPAARQGLIPAASYGALVKLLRDAAATPRAKALLDFDRALARALRDALSPSGPIAAPAPGLEALHPTAAPAEAHVKRELNLRLAFANNQMEPQLVDAPRAPLDAPRLVVLSGEGKDKALFIAQLYQRVGERWLHPGLPTSGLPKKRLFVPPTSYWRRWAHAANKRSHLEGLATRVLDSALATHGPSLLLAAARSITASQLPRVLKLHQSDATGMAALLRGLPAATLRRQGALLIPYARHTSPAVRAAALVAFGRIGERGLLRKALTDKSEQVSSEALVALLQLGDGDATKEASRRLARPGEPRRRLLMALEASSALASATKAQQRALERDLSRLYRKQPALRASLLRLAAKLHLIRLSRLGLEAKEISLRRLAAAALAAAPSVPMATLDKLSKDPDVQIALSAQIGLARLKDASSLLKLGPRARQGCVTPARVIPVLAPSMDKRSRRRLLADVLRSPCPELAERIWPLIAKFFPRDLELQRAGLGHQRAKVRVLAAITTLGH